MEHLSSVTAPGFFARSFPLLSCLGLVGLVGAVEGVSLPLLISWIVQVTLGSGSRLTKKTRPDVPVHGNRDPGHPTPRRWKRLRLPSSEGAGGRRWACLANLFLSSGLGEVCAGKAWNLPLEGTGIGVSGWSVQPEGTSALAPVQFV